MIKIKQIMLVLSIPLLLPLGGCVYQTLNADEITYTPNHQCENKVLSILFKYQGEEYLIWTSNGFYATGRLYKLNGLPVPNKHQRRPSFDVQYKLLSMKHEYEQGQLQESLEEFEKGLYKKEDNK